MNILFISTMFNYFKDDNASFPRMYNFLNELRKEHNVCVLHPLRLKGQEEFKLKQKTRIYYYPELKIGNRKLWYFTDFNFKFLSIVRKIVKSEKIVLIHIDYPYGGILLRFLGIPFIYNSHNIESSYYSDVGRFDLSLPRLIRSILPQFIWLLEFFVCRLARIVINISNIEREKMGQLYHLHKNKLVTIQNGVQKHYLENPISRDLAISNLNLDPQKHYILFHGGYYSANQEAYYNIIQKIAPKLQTRSDIIFLFAGKTPKFTGENIVTLGFLPDLKNYLYSGTLAVVPILRGAGVRTKILDYMAAHLPLISTKKGVEGLDLIAGSDFIECNDIHQFTEKIQELLKDVTNREDLSRNLQNLTNKKFNWDHIGEKIRHIYGFVSQF